MTRTPLERLARAGLAARSIALKDGDPHLVRTAESLLTTIMSVAHVAPGPSPEPVGAVVKEQPEDRYMLCVVYSPSRLPLRGADQRVDLASPRVLEQACWGWMSKGARTGMWHEPGHEGEATCVESYIYRNHVPWVIKNSDGGETVVKEGDWLAGFILSPHAWALYKQGAISGVSMQGSATRKAPAPETLQRVKGITNVRPQ